MADPLSLAASVAGLVSLGLQVTSGITKYLDAVKCRDEELSEIRRQNGLLKDTLRIIEKTAAQLDQVPPDVAAATQRIIESHHDSLNKLETLVAQLTSSDVGTWRARLKDKAGKLHYAFDRPKLQELCCQAAQTQSALQLALEGLSVSLTAATHGSLQAGLGSVHHQLQDSFQAARGQVFTSTQILSQQLRHTEDTIQSSFNIQHGYLDRIQVQNTDIVGRVAGMERTLQTLAANLLDNDQLDDQTYGLRYTGLARVIKAAIGVSFDMRSGAGGWSVGPSFSYYPTVDAENDQSFRIMDILREVFYGRQFGGEAADSFHQKALRKIVRLLVTGKTSPLAVDHCNRSLMHVAFNTFRFEHKNYLLAELVQTLVLHGVPPISYDIWGRGPGLCYFASETESWMPRDSIIDSLAIVADVEGGTMPLTLVSEWTGIFIPTPYHPELALSPSLAEAFGCGPLSMAILANDAQLAQSLLQKYPTSIEEVNIFGHTPLHIAASQNVLPWFPFVLEAAKAAGLLQREDSFHQTALFAALAMTGEHCHATTQTSEYIRCNCVDSMMMLRETGSVVCDSDFYLLDHHFPSVSLRGWGAFIAQVKVQRENLKELALHNIWAVEEHLAILQSEKVLDLHAYAVYKSLRRHGIDVPMDLVPSDYTSIASSYWISRSERKTVYDCIDPFNESICELSFRMGFQDIDFSAPYGLPPLCRASEIPHINWLIQQGADIKRRVWPADDEQLQNRGIFSAHYVLYHSTPDCLDLQSYLRPYRSCRDPQSVTVTNRVLSVSLAANLTDSCCCACSTKGCTPFLFLFKGQCGWKNQRIIADMRSVADMDFHAIFDGLPTEMVRSLYLAAVRFVGFVALDLTHTCCDACAIVKWKEPYRTRDRYEVNEIQEEESGLIEVLDNMVAEFQNTIANISGDSALSQFQACWESYWTDRVPEILEGLGNHRMSEAERLDAELIGVLWESESGESEEDTKGNPYDPDTIDHWHYELDLIAEEV
ncbi:hypothetical protein PG991_008061 [Apiospora marii]|uniref:Fungal N-terminal domain-containing protein n=1 Tax=Apiospora marii TaxID=335849 RepID=A0ABR1RV92_9PEZI